MADSMLEDVATEVRRRAALIEANDCMRKKARRPAIGGGRKDGVHWSQRVLSVLATTVGELATTLPDDLPGNPFATAATFKAVIESAKALTCQQGEGNPICEPTTVTPSLHGIRVSREHNAAMLVTALRSKHSGAMAPLCSLGRSCFAIKKLRTRDYSPCVPLVVYWSPQTLHDFHTTGHMGPTGPCILCARSSCTQTRIVKGKLTFGGGYSYTIPDLVVSRSLAGKVVKYPVLTPKHTVLVGPGGYAEKYVFAEHDSDPWMHRVKPIRDFPGKFESVREVSRFGPLEYHRLDESQLYWESNPQPSKGSTAGEMDAAPDADFRQGTTMHGACAAAFS